MLKIEDLDIIETKNLICKKNDILRTSFHTYVFEENKNYQILIIRKGGLLSNETFYAFSENDKVTELSNRFVRKIFMDTEETRDFLIDEIFK